MSFELTTLGEYAVVQGGFAYKSQDFVSEPGIAVLKIKNIRHGCIDYALPSFVSDGTARSSAKWFTAPGDILISMTGSGPSAPESLVGRVARVWEQEPRALINQRVGRLRLKEGSEIDQDFLFYLLSQKEIQDFLVTNSTGSANQVNISSKTIEAVPCPRVGFVESQEIANFLNVFEQRIRLLRETNATLEAIAQALFKSWFVDFDPVRAKLEGRAPEGMDEATAALFPDAFEESELGLVPSGWKVMPMGQLCSVTIGGLWGKDEQDEVGLNQAISLRGVDLEHLRIYGFAEKAPVRWVKDSAMEKRRLNETQVLIASSGAGPCGRPLWGGFAFEALYGIPVIFSNFVKRLDCETSGRAIFIDRMLANMRETREIWNYINGTSIPNLDDKLLLATKKVLLPSNEILSAFETISRTFYEQLYCQQAQTLATLRDTLLPRLISGQLRLPETL